MKRKRHQRHRATLFLAVSIVVGCVIHPALAKAIEDESRRSTTGDAVAAQPTSVEEWVERLGSPSYATRQRAREMLQRLGLEAFDALHKAQFHPDSEIAMSARHLVSSLMVSWSKETDSADVRGALADYGAQSEVDRGSRMELLAKLPDREGLEALVRLTRFETSLRLSGQAALLLMQQPMSDDEAQRRRESELVIDVLGSNDRQAADWLRVYAEDLAVGRYSAAKWRVLISKQRREIDTASTQQANRATVLELIRVCAARAATLRQSDEALKLAVEHMDLISPTSRDLIDAANWAIDHELHSFVLQLRQNHPRIFAQQAVLLYCAAEAMVSAGDELEAEQLASQASKINPLPTTSEEKNEQSPRAIEEIARAHLDIGKALQDKGLFRWAEREHILIIDSLEVTALPSVASRLQLASLFAELLRHRDVVDVLEPLQQRISSDEKLVERLNAGHVQYSQIPSVLLYHRGLAEIVAGELEAAKPKLLAAFEADPENVDILISMYRLDGGEQWRTKVAGMLQRQIRLSEMAVQKAEMDSRQAGRPSSAEADLAQALNGYAWLVSNTVGDHPQALQFSLRSLESAPDSEALLDTCARCYFAVGDLENAVRMQKRALKILPHSPPLQRQLAEFEAALATANRQ